MDKIIVRDNILGGGRINSAIISLCGNKEILSYKDFEQCVGIKKIMKEVFMEEIEDSDIKKTQLHTAYVTAFNMQCDNNFFKLMYRVDESFAVHLSQNIYLYHLVAKDDVLYPSFLPWFYADSKVFLGDTWWESDEEVLDSLISLPIVEFIKRYKGY